jgi:hypothetical protein
MHTLEVGKRYNSAIESWPEGAQYNYRGNTHELLLFFSEPSKSEISSVKSGTVDIAVTAVSDILLLLFRFEPGIPWSDAPYSYWMVPSGERAVPPVLQGEQRPILQTILIDAGSGIIHAIRTVSLSTRLGSVLHEQVRDQAAKPITQAQYDSAIDNIFTKYQTKALLERAIAKCKGGE